MKIYQKLVPILLVVLMAVSAYQLISDKVAMQSEYNGYLKEAEAYYKEGIVVDAVAALEKAYDMNPSIKLLLKEGEYFQSVEYVSDSIRIAEELLETYPKETESYDYALNCYMMFDRFEECYEVLDTAEKRNIKSDTTKKITEELKYKYDLTGRSFEKIGGYNAKCYTIFRRDYWGYCNQKGQVVIDCIYKNAGPFVNDVAPVTDIGGNTYFIDTEGNKKLNIPSKLKCEKAGALISDTVVLLCNGKYGYYDGKFNYKFGNYDYASAMYNSAAAIKEGNYWHLIDSSGKKINKSPYADIKINEIEIANMSDIFFVKSGEKYIMVDSKGKQIGKSQFDDAKCFSDGEIAAVKIEGKWGFVDPKGKIVIEPQYEEARSFSNELAAVKKDGKWGYIDKDNKIVIECQFDDCNDFNNGGFAFVKEPGDEKYSTLTLYSKNH